MKIVGASFGTAQTNASLVAGVANKIIRVTRIWLMGSLPMKFRMVSDPTGTPAALTPDTPANTGVTELRLGRTYALNGGRGKGIGVTTTAILSEGEHGIVIWYEVVD